MHTIIEVNNDDNKYDEIINLKKYKILQILILKNQMKKSNEII